jgi:ketosteroid isomerase-like protein
MSLDRTRATAFVDGYGRTWDSWDIAGFVDLFSDDIVYVAHPTETTVVGKEALTPYVEGQEAQMGTISVRMGKPIVDGNHVAAEFWVTATNQDGEETTAGCLMAQLDRTDGRCTHFREYWFDIEGHTSPFTGWGE